MTDRASSFGHVFIMFLYIKIHEYTMNMYVVTWWVQEPSQHAVIGPRADISGWQAAVLGMHLPITARFPAADAALALVGGDLSELGLREARALISDARW